LAAQLADLAGRDDVVVLGLPRGGVPVAAEVAAAIEAPLDVFVVRKIGAPQQPELALGAVASGGTVVLNDEIVGHLDISGPHLDELIAAQHEEVSRREHLYRGDRPPLVVTGMTAVVVDDGIATGASMRVALVALRRLGASALIAAAPVAPPEMRSQLGDVADRVELVETPLGLGAVGAWYDDFRQVGDDEVQRLLNP
jgi:putative phosphoribosyl transferase